MYWIVALIVLSHCGLIGLGVYCEHQRPASERARRRIRRSVAANLLLFALAEAALLFLAVDRALAQPAGAGGDGAVSTGMGLALIGIGLPTGVAALGAGFAVGWVGSAGIAVLAEKPEAFGRTLVYLGLAEGIAIYGLVVSILLLGKV